ncbi:N2,N2-dimethylguanosine tRNA methyltransferase [Encephalitozoon intestinalis ATCC 50506]|uniref:tRNA (guanine(26)-N(2))-dimethyltransferase n=1 Tax=Encephalitozoon intestinalis (strain ATCC 50506) TaxID=876142 RepID=E0S8D8_ENCIT|nr:N2,N2-dimethylguanosine tRNA methyltransferase [Encephalitozoon intestinalis ATCC 50506]ADM12075.1 N2,N2-dimethylguanosine tRNA methyltransferase [Encephalitozoon intestinalis ATCC 50506]UTX45867.1 tRNA (guanine(26)-N(2))-dimethyltransferase [Encephalitozoon intestinalis]
MEDSGSKETIQEESTTIIKNERTFFNPAQKFNRDISVEIIRECFKDSTSIRILDAMSATGLRGIRYLKEIENSRVYLNDISQSSVETIKANILLNGIEDVECFESVFQNIKTSKDVRATITKSDCNVLMASLPCFFDVIDIDPFGSCSEYIDSALRAIRHRGIICLTATDKGVLCSNERKCLIKYSTSIMKGVGTNEVPLRTIISLVSRQASKFDCSVEPVASLSIDFYVRIFLRIVRRNPRSVIEKNSLFWMCTCHNIFEVRNGEDISNKCDNCSRRMKLCGPFWNGPLNDINVIQGVLNRAKEDNKRLIGVLRHLEQELPTMFYYEIPRLCSILGISSVKQLRVMHALANMGYRVSYTHSELNAIKTDAPIGLINKVLLLSDGSNQEKAEVLGLKFEGNKNIEALETIEFFKGLIKSGMGPLSLPKKH